MKILAGLLLMAGIMATAEEIQMTYSCQIGEKPGVPRYRLVIDGPHFQAEKNILMLEPTSKTAGGTLTALERASLQKLLSEMHDGETRKAFRPKLEGHYRIELVSKGRTTTISAGSSAPAAGPEKLFDWIRRLHATRAELKEFSPIFPGDEYKAKY